MSRRDPRDVDAMVKELELNPQEEADYRAEKARKARKRERFKKAEIDERVRLALPFAREGVLWGALPSQEDLDNNTGWDSLWSRMEELAGVSLPESMLDPRDEIAERDQDDIYLMLEVAYTLGLAAGLFLRPELFTQAPETSRRGAR